MRFLLSALAVALFVSGCANLAVGPSSPHPNVILAAAKTPGTLVLGPQVSDNFTVAGTASVNEVPVSGWRKTIDAGFHNAFPSAAANGRKLELMQADLSFAPAAIGPGGTAAVVATIRFKARVIDATGERGVLAGTVHAREANTSASEAGMTDNASKAIEALYEVLVAELLQKS
jgi:hypothetical protein